jgi:hypothetical protein
MAKWLHVQLNKGKIGEQALISGARLEQMHTPQIFVDDQLARHRYGHEFTSYGLGWSMSSHRGHVLIEHDGMTDGFYTLVSMMPREGVGIVALSNCDAYYNPVQNNLVPNIVAYTLYDRLLGLEPTDWNERLQRMYAELVEATTHIKERVALEDKVNAPASHPIEAYLGDYRHPGYGVISIRKAGDQLQAVINDKLTLPLEHCHYDIFEVYFELADQRQKLAFLTDLEGKISQVACQMEPKVKEIMFARVSVQRLTWSSRPYPLAQKIFPSL